MVPVIIIIAAAAALFVLYLLAIRPNTGRREIMRPFQERPVAHRGLFDNRTVPENSLPAFARAVEAGFPIELDVQLTADDRLVVFHDASLKRVCGDPRKVCEVPFEELEQLRLLGTEERIPLFEEVLELIGGKVPLVMEIKPEGRYIRTAEMTSAMLKSYSGKVCLESFHPMVLSWYKKNDPGMPRGLLATDFFREENTQPGLVKFLLTNLMLNFLARPDFISYNFHFSSQPSYRLCRALYRPVNAAWTIKSQKELEAASKIFSVFIFDSFIPEEQEEYKR
ncbi:MAG: glycerophosphodiester phosphodiesterase [Firmicutes bacterium]|nr:glycerophosphodiester phosphodiesterase [Bacillota bacterium]